MGKLYMYMNFVEIAAISIGMSLIGSLIFLVSLRIIYGEIKLPDLIDWKVLLNNSLVLSCSFFLLLWGLPLLIDSFDVTSLTINVIGLLIIFILPTYQYFFSIVLTFKNKSISKFELESFFLNKIGNVRVLKTTEEVSNAYAIGVIPNSKTILLSNDLIEKMNKFQLLGVLAHELGHLKKNHVFKIYLVTLFAILIGYISTFYFYPLIDQSGNNIHVLRSIHGMLFYGLPIWLIPNFTQRFFEYEADRFAAELVGKKNIIEALNKLDEITEGNLTSGNITHPKLKKRIANILKSR